MDEAPLWWPVHRLTGAYARGELSPVEVAEAGPALAVYRERVDRCFDQCDVLATPATATPAFRIGHRPSSIDGQPVGRLWGAFPFSAPFNLSGRPAVVLPAGFVDGLPAAVQLIGRRGADAALLRLAADLEEAMDLQPFQRQRPPRSCHD